MQSTVGNGKLFSGKPPSGLSILMHGVISLQDATSYDKRNLKIELLK